ncbi:MAG TPA: DNA polymerase III subunit chi [Burkholderiaceae bacterium]|nr:DNA polymerase III subunit chi [Burkholderiaceae bacterium]
MTRIDFHTGLPDKLAYCCRLLRKVQAAGQKALVYSSDPQTLAELDRQLWTFSPLDFLPHQYAHEPDAELALVLLTGSEAPTQHHRLLINLDRDHPPAYASHERVIELVSTEAEDAQAGRQRFKFYRDQGYPLQHHVAGA